MSMASTIVGPRRVKVWEADAEWPDDAYVVPAEDYDMIEVDRDIKAANLHLLVEKVLAIDVDSDKGTWDAIEAALDLARSLKQ